MLKLLLIAPPLSRAKVYGKFSKVGSAVPPLGLLYIAAYSRHRGIEVDFFDASIYGRTIQDVVERVRDFKPDLIGFTCVTFAVPVVLETAVAIKESCPSVKIAVGGPHISAMPEEMLKHNAIDFAVSGDGEYVVFNLISNLNNEAALEKIPGLYFKKGGGVIISGPPAEQIKDLDTLPYPAIDLLESLDPYRLAAISYRRKPVFYMFTSRGCPFRCIFCNSSREKTVRYHSVGRVIEEIKYLVEHFGIREVAINDDTFTVNKKRLIEICEALMRLPKAPIWSCNIQVSTVDKEMLTYMKKAGCWLVMPGVESGNPDVLKVIKKGIKLEQVRQVCEWAKELKLCVKPSFIIGHPTETIETINDTIKVAKDLYSHYPSFALMTPFPGTELWQRGGEFGTFNKNDYSSLSPAASRPPFIPNGLTEEILVQKQREAYRRVYFNAPMLFRHLKGLQSWEDICRNFRGIVTIFKI